MTNIRFALEETVATLEWDLNQINVKLARLTERLDDLDHRHQRDTQETGREVDNLYRRLNDRDRSRR